MGYKLAEQVQQNWSHLDHGPYRLILGIALALPEESRRCWFGRDRYGKLLGKAPETDAEKENAYKSVQRMIKALIAAGALRLISAAKPGRSAVYELRFPASDGGQSMSTIATPMEDAQRPPSEAERGTANVPNGGRSVTPMGDAQRPEWGTADVPPKKNEEEVEEEVDKPFKAKVERHVVNDFGDWYAIYPRHVSRAAAERAYAKAIKNGAATEDLKAAAERYAAERQGQDPKYTKHPATWLAQECWLDEPAAPTAQGPWDPAYHRGPLTTSQKMANTIAAGHRLQAQHDARNGLVPRQYAWCNPPKELEAPEEESA